MHLCHATVNTTNDQRCGKVTAPPCACTKHAPRQRVRLSYVQLILAMAVNESVYTHVVHAEHMPHAGYLQACHVQRSH